MLELVREAVGDDCAIGARFCDRHAERATGCGIEVEEDGVRFIEHVDHLVDLWDVQVGAAESARHDATRWRRRGFARRTRRSRGSTRSGRIHDKPIVGVGRFTNPDTMVEVIRSRPARHHRRRAPVDRRSVPAAEDRGGPARRDPRVHRLQHLHRPLQAGRCRLVCTQNPTAGEEYRRGWHPERFTRARNADNDVLVVGAGPAGMECAIVLGKRGMRRVHLVEAEDELGGSDALDPAAARARRVGTRRRLPADPDREAEERRVHPEHEARRDGRGGVRRRDRRRRDRLALGDRRPERLDPRCRSPAPTRACRTA